MQDLFGNTITVEDKKPSKVGVIRDKIRQGKERSDLFTINSISGGRSSAFMAYHNRADMNLFSIVNSDDPRCAFRDSAVRQYVWEKCGTDLIYATLESDETIKSIIDLEQFLGEDIFFVYGPSMDSVIAKRKFLPNKRSRFCTTETKLKPIFDFLHLKGYTRHQDFDNPTYERLENYFKSLTNEEINSPYYRVNIGYRIDDYERIERFSETFDHVVGKHTEGSNIGQNKWETVHWRVGNFPIIHNTQKDVINFWKGKPISFPEMNNCEFCFHRPVAALKKQLTNNPRKAVFWKEQEKRMGSSFHSDYTLDEIEKLSFTEALDFTSQSMCSSGGCTD